MIVIAGRKKHCDGAGFHASQEKMANTHKMLWGIYVLRISVQSHPELQVLIELKLINLMEKKSKGIFLHSFCFCPSYRRHHLLFRI